MKVDYSANARRLCDLLFGRILCPEHAGLELGIILEGAKPLNLKLKERLER